MDENDRAESKINLDSVFKKKDPDFPFYIDVSNSNLLFSNTFLYFIKPYDKLNFWK